MHFFVHTCSDPSALRRKPRGLGISFVAALSIGLAYHSTCSGQTQPETANPQTVDIVHPITIAPSSVTPLIRGQADFQTSDRRTQDAFCEIEGSLPIHETNSGTRPCDIDSNAVRDRFAETESRSSCPSQSAAGADGGTSTIQKSNSRTAVFAEAAHFCMDEGSSMQPVFQRRPLTIYEGMTVRVTTDGHYEVRALVEGPRVNSIVRLQLKFTTSSSDGVQQSIGIVTLPPIRLKSEQRSPTQLPEDTQTWFVRRTGYSERLRQALAAENVYLAVSRGGTVQSGQVPDAAGTY